MSNMTLIFIYWSFSSFHRISGCWTYEFWTPLSRSPHGPKGHQSSQLPQLGASGLSHREQRRRAGQNTNPMSVILNAVCRGTADHVWMQRTEKQSIIAQAECKYWDWKQIKLVWILWFVSVLSKYTFGLNCFFIFTGESQDSQEFCPNGR